MRRLCPNCEQAQDVVPVTKLAKIEVRGVTFYVQVKGYKCKVCGEFFAEQGTDELELAYKAYEKLYGVNPRRKCRNSY
jgi:hypothetical protein